MSTMSTSEEHSLLSPPTASKLAGNMSTIQIKKNPRYPHKTCKYAGVTFRSSREKYQARIYKGNKEYNLGLFEVAADAALAYDTTHRLLKKITVSSNAGSEKEAMAAYEADSEATHWLDFDEEKAEEANRCVDKDKLNFEMPQNYREERELEINESKEAGTQKHKNSPSETTVKMVVRKEAIRVVKVVIGLDEGSKKKGRKAGKDGVIDDSMWESAAKKQRQMESMMYGSNPAMMGYNPYFNQSMMMPQQGMMQQGMMPGQTMMNSPLQQQAMMHNQASMMNMQMQQMCAKQEPPGATATPNTGADKSSFVSPNMTSTAEAGNVTNNFSPMAAFSNMYGMGNMPRGGNTGNKTGEDFREFFNGHGMHASAVGGGGTASLGGGNIGQMRGMDDIQYMMCVRQQQAARQQMMAQNSGAPNNMMPSIGGYEVTKKDLDEKVKQMEHLQGLMQASPYRGGGDSSQQRQDSVLQNSQLRSQFKFTSANMGYNC